MTELNRELLVIKYGDELENLKEINLNGGIKSNSIIKKIDCDTFKGLANLEILYLDNNELTEIDGNLFSDLLNLKELYLNDNKLKCIDSVYLKD